MEVHSNPEHVSVSQCNKISKELCIVSLGYANASNASHIGKINTNWMMLSASSFLLQHKILGLSQIIHSFLDTLFNMVTEFPSPGLIDIMHTCLDASGGTWITWDHVSLLRVGCTEWISGLFCVLPFCWGSVHSFCPQPWRPDKNYSSSAVHVNQSGEI